jgi:hypothetical protein
MLLVDQELMMHRRTLVRSLGKIPSVLRDKPKLLKVLDLGSTVLKRQPLLSSQINLSQVSPRHRVVLCQRSILMVGLAPINRLKSLLPRKWRLVNAVIKSWSKQLQDLVFTSPQSVILSVTHQQPPLWVNLVANLRLWALLTVQEAMLATWAVYQITDSRWVPSEQKVLNQSLVPDNIVLKKFQQRRLQLISVKVLAELTKLFLMLIKVRVHMILRVNSLLILNDRQSESREMPNLLAGLQLPTTITSTRQWSDLVPLKQTLNSKLVERKPRLILQVVLENTTLFCKAQIELWQLVSNVKTKRRRPLDLAIMNQLEVTLWQRSIHLPMTLVRQPQLRTSDKFPSNRLLAQDNISLNVLKVSTRNRIAKSILQEVHQEAWVNQGAPLPLWDLVLTTSIELIRKLNSEFLQPRSPLNLI